MKTPRPYAEIKAEALLKRQLFCEAQNRSLEYYAFEQEFTPMWEMYKGWKVRLLPKLDDLVHQKHLN